MPRIKSQISRTKYEERIIYLIKKRDKGILCGSFPFKNIGAHIKIIPSEQNQKLLNDIES